MCPPVIPHMMALMLIPLPAGMFHSSHTTRGCPSKLHAVLANACKVWLHMFWTYVLLQCRASQHWRTCEQQCCMSWTSQSSAATP